MKRKHSVVLKAPSARNPFVAAAHFKKAGAHRKSEKALRRQEKVHTGSVAQMDESNRFLPGRCEFDARQVHQKNASQSGSILECVLFRSCSRWLVPACLGAPLPTNFFITLSLLSTWH